MEQTLRNWKCWNCGRANSTEVALNGTADCPHCRYQMLVDGLFLPASYPPRRGVSTSHPERPLPR